VFADKVAVVTGGARGIGRATAEKLSAGGARVLIADLDSDVAEATAAEIGNDASAFAGNITADGVPDKLIAAALDRYGRLDIIVNNAGYTLDSPLHKLGDEDFQAMIDIHTVAPFRILRAAAPHMREAAKKERDAGEEVFRKVVNVSSMAAYGNPGQANYSAAKAALIGLTKTAAREWGQFKINCNVVAFGLVDTRLTQAKDGDSSVDIDGRSVPAGIPAGTLEIFKTMIPLGRGAKASEAAGGIAFFCSPWSDYVTGQVLNVGGGIPLGMSS
jgi:3-oxoacyl-[acyl-carrier protein] reductase